MYWFNFFDGAISDWYLSLNDVCWDVVVIDDDETLLEDVDDDVKSEKTVGDIFVFVVPVPVVVVIVDDVWSKVEIERGWEENEWIL